MVKAPGWEINTRPDRGADSECLRTAPREGQYVGLRSGVHVAVGRRGLSTAGKTFGCCGQVLS